MIQEDYVSFETAKLLKEKGFDVPCFAYYYVMSHKTVIAYEKDFPKNSDLCLIYANMEFGSLPTLQMTMKWLREVHNLFISIGNDDLDYNWQIFDIKNRTKDLDPICLTECYGGYKKYELACTLAIKYCLANLI